MVAALLVMLLPLVTALQQQNVGRGRFEIWQVREGEGRDHSPEGFPNYVPVPDADESWQVIQANVLSCFGYFCQLLWNH